MAATTTGELLVEYSTLDIATALEHFLNISTGDGSGVLQVMLEDPDTVVVAEQEATGVTMEEADFDVKVVQKETIVIKE